MEARPFKVLLIEDNFKQAWLVREMLATARGAPFRLECASALAAGLERLAAGGIDVVLLDLSLQDVQGLNTLVQVQAQAVDLPVLVLTSAEEQALGVEALRKGAQDSLVKEEMDGNQLVCAMLYAIARKQMERTLVHQYHELSLLTRAIQAFTSTLDLDQVLASVLEEVRRLLNVAACSVWLVERETGELVCQQATGQKREVVQGWQLAPGEGIIGWVVGQGRHLIVPDVLEDPRHFTGVDQVTGIPLRSALTIPLKVRQQVIGALQVLDTAVDRFNSTDLMLLEPLATAAAAALENARLYEETERLRVFNENIVQSMEEGILLDDVHGAITFVNAKTARMLGYDPQELIGQHRMVILAPECLVEIEDQSLRWAQGEATRHEAALLTKDGRRVPVFMSARPLFEEGRFKGVLSVLIDLSSAGRGSQGEGREEVEEGEGGEEDAEIARRLAGVISAGGEGR